MATYSVVEGKNEAIDRISFSVGSFVKDPGKGMHLECGIMPDNPLRITSEQHAQYMIAALQKAIEFKWFDQDGVDSQPHLTSRSPNV